MTKKKKQIQTHFENLTVSVREDATESRGGMHDTALLDRDEVYNAIATFMHVYNDGSQEPAFLIDTPTGIVARACSIFVVDDVERKPSRWPWRIGPMLDVDLYSAYCVDSIGLGLFEDINDSLPDGHGDNSPAEVREVVESSVNMIIRKVLAALGHTEGTLATLRVPNTMATDLRALRKRYGQIDELLDENPDTPQTRDDEHRKALFEEQAETAIELAAYLLDLMPTMEVYN